MSPGFVIMSLKPFVIFGISAELINDIKNADNVVSIKSVIFSLRVLERISAVLLGVYFLSMIFLREMLQRANEINIVAKKNIITSLCERIFNI